MSGSNTFGGTIKLEGEKAYRQAISQINSVKEFFINGWNGIVSFFTETIPSFIASVIEWFNQLPYQLGFIIRQTIGHIIKFGMDLLNFASVTVPEFINQVVAFLWLCLGKSEHG